MYKKRNIRAVIEFDGTHYKGFQKQSRISPTVQGVLEQVIRHTINEKVKVYGCSRTDAGVHGVNYTISFRTDNPIPAENLRYVTNKKLPSSIYIKSMEDADQEFHARHLAKSKHYVYKILQGERPFVSEHNYKYYYPKPLCLDKIREAMKDFEGQKNFRAFSTKQRGVDDFERTVYQVYLTEQAGNEIWFHFVGRGFVYNMIRIMVATLLEVGAGCMETEKIHAAFATGDRSMRAKKAPAAGLYLQEVFY